MSFQTVKSVKPDRKDHVWKCRKNDWICVSCGATTKEPPEYPTDRNWQPDRYEKLTAEIREMCPK